MLFIDPWFEEHYVTFLQELRKEVSTNHVLYDIPMQVIARRMDRDDVLFKFENSAKVAQVHLTWKSNKENDPSYPKTTIHDSILEWRDRVMLPDSREFN